MREAELDALPANLSGDAKAKRLRGQLDFALLFGIEFVLIYRGLLLTSASRAVVFLYTAPFFVALREKGLAAAAEMVLAVEEVAHEADHHHLLLEHLEKSAHPPDLMGSPLKIRAIARPNDPLDLRQLVFAA